ncbi:MAG TPA: dihydrolipoamide acetyltransferase family protein [Candidatus Sulfotelmatobacter sp.]|jgi:pyruvate dehydrogenase E2 component (dihydrolipoamide acetyltransferase)|nr:dihydrolipoamide acetyltransferase family protein [Candidatus Sulfotelmatobacter sp.]
MAISVVMPALEMAQENGKLLAWRKKEGDSVSKGEPLLEIETDKAVVEVEAPGDGILAGITAEVGAVIPVGETIAWLVAPGEKPPAKAMTAAPAARATSAAQAAAPAPAQARPAAATGATAQISPKARRLAKELGVDIGQIRGSGPDGTITSEDVQAAANAKGAASPAVAAAVTAVQEPLSQLARLMAERTTQSWTSVPHFFLVKSVDAGALIETQKKLSQGSAAGTAPTITDVLIKLIARVLEKHPRMNASWAGDGIRMNPDINISVAMAVKDGVVGAVIPNAHKQPIAALSVLRRELTERARAGRLRPADISGGTFTLSNLGMYKMDAFTAIITPPQCAILAVGAIADAVAPVDGKPSIRPMMTMTLSSDHRVVDGARAAEFLLELTGAIREPEKWL